MANSHHKSIPTQPIVPRAMDQQKGHTSVWISGPSRSPRRTQMKKLYWDHPCKTIRSGSFETDLIEWFPEGGLNASYTFIDQWVHIYLDKGRIERLFVHLAHRSALQLQRPCRRAPNIRKAMGSKKSDTLSVYTPTIEHAVATFLAFAPIGVVHSVDFAGFSSESLRDHIKDCKSPVSITTDEDRRVERLLRPRLSLMPLSSMGRDKRWREETIEVPSYYPPEVMSAEDPLFILHKVVHTAVGCLLGAPLTVKYASVVHPGRTGPLLNGVTTTVLESTTAYPTPSRYWQVVEKRRITHFYTAPTAIRLIRRLGERHTQADLSTARVLAWDRCDEHVVKKQCAIFDTRWHAETGSITITPFPGAFETKPGSATAPSYDIEPVILDPVSGQGLINFACTSGAQMMVWQQIKGHAGPVAFFAPQANTKRAECVQIRPPLLPTLMAVSEWVGRPSQEEDLQTHSKDAGAREAAIQGTPEVVLADQCPRSDRGIAVSRVLRSSPSSTSPGPSTYFAPHRTHRIPDDLPICLIRRSHGATGKEKVFLADAFDPAGRLVVLIDTPGLDYASPSKKGGVYIPNIPASLLLRQRSWGVNTREAMHPEVGNERAAKLKNFSEVIFGKGSSAPKSRRDYTKHAVKDEDEENVKELDGSCFLVDVDLFSLVHDAHVEQFELRSDCPVNLLIQNRDFLGLLPRLLTLVASPGDENLGPISNYKKYCRAPVEGIGKVDYIRILENVVPKLGDRASRTTALNQKALTVVKGEEAPKFDPPLAVRRNPIQLVIDRIEGDLRSFQASR
ncbi:hypothetical protein BJ322DRAFT_1017008 [Thelephora terrestris]|uniref:acetate--CoA ligase n=1 Tax=Thelephora terrestris TaxID=56493 RepID=A0A9P6HZJ2_9AGAM|nr:hypothetical protein BJ322DRAFT_1017008 [Thelephora terrestris]